MSRYVFNVLTGADPGFLFKRGFRLFSKDRPEARMPKKFGRTGHAFPASALFTCHRLNIFHAFYVNILYLHID